MNVLLVSQYLSAGGLERMVHLMGGCLSRDFGCKVWLYSFDNPADPEVQKNLLEKAGITSIHELKDPGFCRKTLRGMVRVIREREIKIIHTHETAPLMYAVLAKYVSILTGGPRVRIIHTQHSFIHLQKRKFIRFYDRFFQMAAAHLTVVSQQVKDEYAAIGVPSTRTRFIANGVEFPRRLITAEEKKVLRARLISELRDRPGVADELGREKGSFWMVSMARVHPKKGQDHLIRIWGELSEEIKRKSILILAGPETEPGEVGRLKAMLQNVTFPERVIFLGSTPSPVEWLQASDLFLSGSEYEGMPLAPIEACGAGLPLVLSSIKGHLILAGEARFFDFEKPSQGAQAVQECLQDRERDPPAYSEKCRANAQTIQSRYSIQKMTKQYFDLYLN